MLSADVVGLHRKGQVLVNAGILPPHPPGVLVGALERLNAVKLSHHPLPGLHLLQLDQGRGEMAAAGFLLQAPAPQVMRARHHAGPDPLGDPDPVHEIADLGVDLDEVPGDDPEAFGVPGMQPYRILVRDLVEPLGVARAAVNEGGQPEGGQQQHLPLGDVDVGRVDVALDVPGKPVLGPLPVLEGLGIELELPRGRREAGLGLAVHLDAEHGAALGDDLGNRVHHGFRHVRLLELGGVAAVDVLGHQEGAVLAHVFQRRDFFLGRGLRQARHAVLEHPLVVLRHRELLARPVRRLEVFPDTQGAVGIDAPGQLDPELVLFPHFPQPGFHMGLPGGVEGLAPPFHGDPQHRLAKTDPARRVGLLAHEIVPLRRQAHGQHVVREPGGLAPGGRETGVTLHLGLVAQHLDPAHAVRVGPHRVVDPGKIHGQFAPALLDEVRQQKAHLEERQRVFRRIHERVPLLGRRRHHRRRRDELVPGVGGGAAGRAHGAHQHHQELQRPGYFPAAQVAGGGVAPHVGGQRGAGPGHLVGHFHDHGRVHPGLGRGELRRVLRVEGLEDLFEALEGLGLVRMFLAQELLPVDPLPHELAVVEILLEQHVAHGQQHRGFGAGPGGHPVVGLGRGVGQPGVDDADLGAPLLGLDDALGVGVEVVPGLQVRAQHQHEARVGMIGRGTVDAAPERVAGPGPGGAHVGVAVVGIDAPGVHDALVIEELMSGAPHVVHDLVAAVLLEGLPDPSGQIVQHFVPGHAFPLAAAALSRPFHGVEDAFRVIHLVDGGRALGAVPAAAARMFRIALELAYLLRFLVHVGQQAAARLAVEADGGDQVVVLLHPPGPRGRVVFGPIRPAVGRGIALESSLRRFEVGGVGVERLRFIFHCGGSLLAASGGTAVGAGFKPARARHGAESLTERHGLPGLDPQGLERPESDEGQQRGQGMQQPGGLFLCPGPHQEDHR